MIRFVDLSRDCAQSYVTGHGAPAGELSGWREGHETDAVEPVGLAAWAGRRASDVAEGRRCGRCSGALIHRSLPHGHVAAVLGVLREIGLDRLIGRPAARSRDPVVALIVSRHPPHARPSSPAPSTSSASIQTVPGKATNDDARTTFDQRLAPYIKENFRLGGSVVIGIEAG
jgi:hypothetical protein